MRNSGFALSVIPVDPDGQKQGRPFDEQAEGDKNSSYFITAPPAQRYAIQITNGSSNPAAVDIFINGNFIGGYAVELQPSKESVISGFPAHITNTTFKEKPFKFPKTEPFFGTIRVDIYAAVPKNGEMSRPIKSPTKVKKEASTLFCDRGQYDKSDKIICQFTLKFRSPNAQMKATVIDLTSDGEEEGERGTKRGQEVNGEKGREVEKERGRRAEKEQGRGVEKEKEKATKDGRREENEEETETTTSTEVDNERGKETEKESSREEKGGNEKKGDEEMHGKEGEDEKEHEKEEDEEEEEKEEGSSQEIGGMEVDVHESSLEKTGEGNGEISETTAVGEKEDSEEEDDGEEVTFNGGESEESEGEEESNGKESEGEEESNGKDSDKDDKGESENESEAEGDETQSKEGEGDIEMAEIKEEKREERGSEKEKEKQESENGENEKTGEKAKKTEITFIDLTEISDNDESPNNNYNDYDNSNKARKALKRKKKFTMTKQKVTKKLRSGDCSPIKKKLRSAELADCPPTRIAAPFPKFKVIDPFEVAYIPTTNQVLSDMIQTFKTNMSVLPPDPKKPAKKYMDYLKKILPMERKDKHIDLTTDKLMVIPIRNDDPRVSLRGKRGVTAKIAMPKGTIIGPYAGKMWTDKEHNDHTRIFTKLAHNIYTHDFEIYIDNCKIVIDALQYGNLTRFINDPIIDTTQPYHATNKVGEPNVKTTNIIYNSWPYVFIETLRDIKQGEEILMEYGTDYWEALNYILGEQAEVRELQQQLHGNSV